MAAPVRLQTHVYNPLGDRRALLLHGLTSDGNTWWRLASTLADAGWMVLAPDLRGHGRSPAGIAYDLDTLAADVSLLGEQWELVVGHSLGGAVAACLLAEPFDIEAAVLIDPVLRVDSAVGGELRQQLHDARSLDAATVRATEPRWDERDVARKVAAAAMVTPDVIDATLADNDPWDIVERSERWRARVHLLAADPTRGALLQGELAAQLVSALPTVTAEVVAGCGHSIHRERPEVVVDAIDQVVAESGGR